MLSKKVFCCKRKYLEKLLTHSYMSRSRRLVSTCGPILSMYLLNMYKRFVAVHNFKVLPFSVIFTTILSHFLVNDTWVSSTLNNIQVILDVGCRHFFLFDKKYVWEILLSISKIRNSWPYEMAVVKTYSPHTDKTSCCVVNHIPYARHYNLRLVYFLPHLWTPFPCFQEKYILMYD